MCNDKDYQDQFVAAQDEIKRLLLKVPAGIQNWPYQKSVNFILASIVLAAFLKLKPSGRHVDFLKMEAALTELRKFYQ